MAIELRGRLGMGQAPQSKHTSKQRGAFFAKGAVEAPATYQLDPSRISALAAQHERNGLDGILVAQSGSSADVWSLAAWSLAATRQTTTVISHRPGLQAPTLAARALASLDQLSGGRVALHVIQGSRDAEQQRDGDFLAKSDRYRRSAEYMEIFNRTLSAEEPFDFAGEFYTVKNAFSQVRPAPQRRPFISSAGASQEGIEFAARYMDGYALFPEPLAQTAQLLERVRSAAQRHGRSLRFWRDANFVLAATDAEARRKVEDLARELAGQGGPLSNVDSVESEGFKRLHRAASVGHWHDRALYTGLLPYGVGGPPFVGSPQTVAAAVLDYYDLGIEIFSVGFDGDSQPDSELAAELYQRIRLGALERDRARAAKLQEVS